MPENYLSVEQQLRGIFEQNISHVGQDQLQPESKLREDLVIDSMDLVSLIMEVEESFDIEIPEAEIDDLLTFGDLVAWIEKAVKE